MLRIGGGAGFGGDRDLLGCDLPVVGRERRERARRARPDLVVCVADERPAAGDGLEPKLTRAEIERTLPLLLPERGSQTFGYMDAREWERFAGFFADRGLISTRPTAAEMFTDEYLPGRIPE